MPTTVQTLYAVDPASRKVRAVIQVDPDGWLDTEIEPMLAHIVRASDAAGVKFAVAVSVDSSFVLRSNPATQQFEIDEVETSELLSPHPLHPDPNRLLEAVVGWCQELGAAKREFLALAQLPRRAPEIVALLSGAQIASRHGAVHPIETLEP